MEDHWAEIDSPDSKWHNEIGFVDIQYINLNNDGFKDAIINYYNCEPYANGNCVMPHKAIISSAHNGYRISNEEFLWPDFDIESITYLNSKPILYGYRFDCGNRIKLQHYRIVLKQ